MDHKQGQKGRRNVAGTAFAYSSAVGELGDLDAEEAGAGTTASSSKRTRGDKNDDAVDIFGVRVFVRGLSALAQVQGLPNDHYSLTGAAATAGATLSGDINNYPGVFVLVRRALQQIGLDLAAGRGILSTNGSSILIDGTFTHDSGTSAAGWGPKPFVTPQVPLELDSEANGFGVSERSIAAESLDFLLDVLSRVRSKIESRLPASSLQGVQHFFTRATLCSCLLRGLVYQCMVPKLMPEALQVPDLMMKVKWCVMLCMV